LSKNQISGYLPDERPSTPSLILYALQQIIVMFPATVTVALLTGFQVSTTIFASGFATIVFILITRKKIPLFYGSSFSYVAAITAITGAKAFAGPVPDDLISIAQFGIIMSGFISIGAGLIINRFGQESIEKVLPPTVTGSIAIVIGLSLAAGAVEGTTSLPSGVESGDVLATNLAWIICIITLVSTIVFSVYLKKAWSQVPILLGLLVGYILALVVGSANGINFVDFNKIASDSNAVFALPHFTLPTPSLAAVAAIMPIAIATIPESTAHIFQLDIYVNDLAKKKGSKKQYKIADMLGRNLIGDGVGDIVSGFIGGPAGTNYGENLSTMAITKNFSTPMLIVASVITMIIACFTPLTRAVYSIPSAVISGISIYLFGVIAAQGITIMINRRVDMFSAKNMAVIAVVLIVGVGGTYGFGGTGMIPIFGIELPAIATAAVLGIVFNLVLSIGKKQQVEEPIDEGHIP